MIDFQHAYFSDNGGTCGAIENGSTLIMSISALPLKLIEQIL